MPVTNRVEYHEATFPFIEEAIERLFRETGRPVTHDAIAAAYLQHPVVNQILVERQKRIAKRHTLEWLAANDVAWFSARITAGTLRSGDRFNRCRVNNKWAYSIVSKDASRRRSAVRTSTQWL